MKQFNKFLLTLLLTGAGASTAFADAYTCNFDQAIDTSTPEFKVASNWRHLPEAYTTWMGSKYYMNYSWKANEGVDGSGTLVAYQQYATDGGWSSGQNVFDCLVTPIVGGEVTIDVKDMDMSTSYPAFIQVYKYDDATGKRGELIKEIKKADMSSSEFSTVTLSPEGGLEEPQRLALRLQYVAVDNFSATDSQIEPEKSITIASCVNPDWTTGGTEYFIQNPDKSVTVRFIVKVTNTGDVALEQGLENYSITILNSKNTNESEPVAVPFTLAPGETSESFEVSMIIPADKVADYWSGSYSTINFILRENLQKTTITFKGPNSESVGYKEYKADFAFTLDSSTSHLSGSYGAQGFGISQTPLSKNYKIRNKGYAPLTINSFSVPEGFTLSCTKKASEDSEAEPVTFPYTLAKGSDFDVTITLSELGTHSGNIEINYIGDGDTEATTFTQQFSGTLIAEGTWTWDFNSTEKNSTSVLNCPPGTIAGGGISGDFSGTSNGLNNNYIKCNSTYNRWITLPKLHAEAGDTFSFDLKKENAGQTFKVFLTTERLLQDAESFAAMEPVFSIATNDLSSSFETKSFTIEEAGDYYIVMEMYGVQLDNLVGLSLSEDVPDYDIYISKFTTNSSSDVESIQTGKTLTPKVTFYALSEIDKSEYTAALFVDGKKVNTAESVLLTFDPKSTKSFEFSYTPEVENTTEMEVFVRFTFDDDSVIETEKKKVKVTNESHFAFGKSVSATGYSASKSDTTPISFGTTNDNTKSLTYKIANWGTKPLTVNSITVPEGFSVDPASCVVESKKEQDVTITFSTATAGTYEGDITIVYVDNDGAEQTYTLGISGTMLDPTKWYVNFNDGLWPAGSAAQSNVDLYSYGTYSEANYSVHANYYKDTDPNRMFVTPLLHAEAGESLNFEIQQGTPTSSSYTTGVKVYAAKNRDNLLKKNADGEYEDVILLGHFASKDVEDDYLLEYNVYKPFSVTLSEEGDWYIGFEPCYYARIDNINGLSPVQVTNDVLLESSSIPTEGMQNKEAVGTVVLRSLRNAIEAGSYTVKSFVDGKESISAEGPAAIEVKNHISTSTTDKATEVSVSFRSPKAGTFPVYFEVTGDGFTLTTDPVEVTFEEEVASADLVIGKRNNYSTSNPFTLNNKNSETIAVYPSDYLEASGLKNGDIIKEITLYGYNSSSSGIHTTEVKAFYSWEDTDALEKPGTSGNYDCSGLTSLYEGNHEWQKGVGSANDPVALWTITLDEPLVYQSGKSLKLFLSSYCNSYNTFYFEQSDKGGYAFNHTNDGTQGVLTGSWISMNLPVIHFTMEVKNTSVFGVVVDGDNAPVENATVRLISEDGDNIQYETTTNSDGEYSINVIQNGRDYTIEAISADGSKETFEEGLNVATESKTLDLQLLDVILVTDDADNSAISGEAVIRIQKSLNSGFNVIALPMSLSQEEVEAIFGEDAMVLELEGETTSGAATVVNFKEVEGKNIVGGKPYLLYLPTESREAEFRMKGQHATMETESTDATAFLATDRRTPIGDKMFVLSEDNFINPTRARSIRAAEQGIPAYSGYIKADNAQSVNFTTSAGITTAVEEIELDELDNETIYDLNGFRVKNPEKGIYIINGKAVLVK